MGRLRVGVVVGGCLMALLAPSGASGAVDRCSGQGQIVAASNIGGAERALLCLVNAYRAAHGRNVLPHNPILRQIARAHSEEMVARHFYDHTNPDGHGPTDRANAAGYPDGVGENIFTIRAFFEPTVASFFQGWIGSAGHRANIVRPEYRAAGMGFAAGFAEEDGPGGPGATGTQTFGFHAQGATDTAVDLFVPAECTEATRDKKRAKRHIRRAKKRLRRADSRRQRVNAKRKLRKARKTRRRAKRQIRRHCDPSRF